MHRKYILIYIQQDATLHSLFISGQLLYMFRVASPPIIRSTHNCTYSILKLGGEAMIPYLARLLDITINNGTLLCDWRRATVVPVYKSGDRLLVTNYRPVSLTSIVCKQMEHIIASYLR